MTIHADKKKHLVFQADFDSAPNASGISEIALERNGTISVSVRMFGKWGAAIGTVSAQLTPKDLYILRNTIEAILPYEYYDDNWEDKQCFDESVLDLMECHHLKLIDVFEALHSNTKWDRDIPEFQKLGKVWRVLYDKPSMWRPLLLSACERIDMLERRLAKIKPE